MPQTGIYASAKKSSRSGPPLVLVLIGAVVAGAVALAVVKGLGSGPPNNPGAIAEADAELLARVAQLEASNATLRAELEEREVNAEAENGRAAPPADWGDVDDFLATENTRLQERIAALEGEVERYREALKKAVAELNAKAKVQAQATQVRRSASRSAAEDPNRWVIVRRPWSTVRGNGEIYVEGSVHNAGSEEVSGTVVLTLTINGNVKTEEVRIGRIPPRTVEDYSTVIRHSWAALQGTSVSVSAEWEPR